MVTCTLKKQEKYRMKKGVKMELGSASWRPKTCEGHMHRLFSVCIFVVVDVFWMEDQHAVRTCWHGNHPQAFRGRPLLCPVGPQ